MLDKLMIVAHPDDESIFWGAALINENGWKVICLTNGDHYI
ncbi:TPA: PIG-L family deacetylase [Bacillus mycoides]|nr:PIG-L family deacetylase [Bacillus mycoides]